MHSYLVYAQLTCWPAQQKCSITLEVGPQTCDIVPRAQSYPAVHYSVLIAMMCVLAAVVRGESSAEPRSVEVPADLGLKAPDSFGMYNTVDIVRNLLRQPLPYGKPKGVVVCGCVLISIVRAHCSIACALQRTGCRWKSPCLRYRNTAFGPTTARVIATQQAWPLTV